ncbi:geranylgeranyl pyrophosphate synthase [Penicillium pulvis]|uniref:geranylgeranyl pyrophosphate synthase n=1 Tax=Penicillium pulvis TaxID=1562058 RepID=UPI002548AC60|nr:geranylgeranyl pyrophosphate synthase [Penicillium pulvis]KAJ5813261.1 geranylgeranyl pyrophosphate synthase [Penicillium pulvis]
MDYQNAQTEQEETSYLVSRPVPDIDGFCHNYTLRRHKYEQNANEGSSRCRDDWRKYIGPIERWGSCNPFDGHFASVVLPLCKPERLALVSYVFEYAFLYDNVLESVSKVSLDEGNDNIVLNETEYRTVRSTTGTKQIQSKMLLELLEIDKPCAEVVITAWKEMVATTASRDKSCIFNGIEEYVDYRIIDTGAPFVDTVMRFGMGIILTNEEEKRVVSIVKPCFAALGLANDFYSFDIEWNEFQQMDDTDKTPTMTNAVWLYMKWENISMDEAKERVRQVVRDYETDFQQRMNIFVADQEQCTPNLREYLTALAFQIPGNIVWSLWCPRYHPELCVEGEALLKCGAANSQKNPQNEQDRTHLIANSEDLTQEYSDSESSSPSSTGTPKSSPSSRSSVASLDTFTNGSEDQKQIHLGTEILLAPFEYINSLPSKGVREALIDALNVWLGLPNRTVKAVKLIAQKLHSSSLMLDDIEDSSPLRRGNPATHTVFGAASTINCANYMLIDVMDEVRKLDDPQCMAILIDELRNLFIGQSFDLHWTREGECPSEEEYLEMVSQKTGGLFRLIVRLMSQSACSLGERAISADFMSLIGKYFQIRDDYMNLMDEEYTSEKGFCEDLDEGKFSFPIVHAWHSQPSDLILRGILQERKVSGSLSVPHKKTVLSRLRNAGSMGYTMKTLERLETDVYNDLDRLEKQNGCENWVMRLLVHRLMVR